MSDLIRIKRGLRANLPTLMQGEFGFCTDTKELFIGGTDGNNQIAMKNDVQSFYNVAGKTTAEIQAAIDAYSGKQTIYFGNTATNVYVLTNSLIVRNNTKIVIEKDVTLRLDVAVNKPIITTAADIPAGGISNVHISGGIFDVNPDNQTVRKSAIALYKVHRSLFENIAILKTKFDGTYDTIGAFYFEGSNYNIIRNCSVTNAGAEGLLLESCIQCTVEGGKYSDNANGSGVATQNGSGHNFVNVWVDKCEGSNFSINSTHCTLYNCRSTNGTGNNAITLGHTGQPASYSIVDSCYVSNCREGIRILGGSKHVTVKNCKVENLLNADAICIGSSDGSSNSKITGNTLTGGKWGVFVVNKNNIIEGNNIELCSYDGISLTSADNSIVNGNITKNNGNFGIELITSNFCLVTNNEAVDTQAAGSRTQKRGIYIDGASNLISANVAVGNTVASISAPAGNTTVNNITDL